MGRAEGMTPSTSRPTSSPFFERMVASSCWRDCQLSRMRCAHFSTRSPSGVRPM